MSEKFPSMIKVVLEKTIIISHSKHHAAGINTVKYSPAGDFIATGGSDDTIRIYDLSGNEIKRLEGHVEPIESIDIHQTKKLLASGSDDSTVRLWDLGLKKEIFCFTEAKKSINAVKFSLDGNTLITGGKDGIIRIYNLESQLLQQEIKIGIITSLAQHPNGELLLVGTTNPSIVVIDIRKGTKVLEIYGHRLPILSLGFSKYTSQEKEYLISSSIDELVKIWDATTFDEITSFQAHSGAVHAVKFSPINASFATSSYDRSVAIWELEAESKLIAKKERYHGAKLAFTDLDWSPDGKSLAMVSADGSLRIRILGESKDSVLLERNDKFITAMILSPDNSSFFLGLENGTLINVGLTGETLNALENAHTSTITDIKILSITATIFFVITSSTDKTIKIWNPKTFKIIAIGKNHEGGVRCIAIAPTKEYLLTTSTDKTIRKYNLKPILYPTKNVLENTQLETTTVNKEEELAEDLKNTISEQTEKANTVPLSIETDKQEEEQLKKGKTRGRKRKSSKRTKKRTTSRKKTQKTHPDIEEVKQDEKGEQDEKHDLLKEDLVEENQNEFSFFDNLVEPLELEELQVYTYHNQAVNTIVFSHNGRFFATASNDYTIVLHDINTDIPMLTYRGHKDHILSLMFSSDDKILYSGGKDGDILIHDIESGGILRTLNVHTDAVRSIVECPINNNFFATISDDNTSALFSISGDKVGQIYFATNPHAIIWDQNAFMYYVSTEIGQLMLVKPITDEITYILSTEENLELVFTKLGNELDKIEKESKTNTITLEQKLYWLNNRISLLEKIKEKSQDPRISQLKRRLEDDLLKYPEEQRKNVKSIES